MPGVPAPSSTIREKNAKLTCTDDSNGGTFTLTLEANDGIAPTVSDNADLTVTNANPTAKPADRTRATRARRFS